MTRTHFAVIIPCLLLAAWSPARADGGIVLESYTGAKPPDAARLVAPLLEELAQHKYESGDTVAHRLDAVARPAITTGIPADFAAQIEHGYDAWLAGKFDQAVASLAPLVETAHANPGAFPDDAAAHDALPRALVTLALAHERSGDPAAAKAMLAELVRAFPDATVTRATYGPEAAEMFAQAQRDVAAAGKGKLDVKVSDASAQIFVDERAVATGSASLSLPPGEYRVFARIGKRLSRSHRITVRANDAATLAIDAGLDVAIRATPYVGLELGAPAEREAHEGEYAVALAKLVGAESVILVGIDQVRGHSAVVASLVSMQTGREIRRADVAIDPDPSTDRLRALARFVAGSEPDPNIEVLLPVRGAPIAAAPGAVDHAGGGHAWGGWKWVATGVAAAGVGAGVGLVAADGSCAVSQSGGRPCTDLRATATPGYAALGGGAVFAALAVYLFVHGSGGSAGDGEPARTVFVAPTAGGVFAGMSTRF